jgi:cytochrome c peroxidase
MSSQSYSFSHMKTPHTTLLFLFLGIAAVFTSCEVSDLENVNSYLDLPLTPYSYQVGVQDEIPTLGRVLFYDPRLSANNAVSCASCHKQIKAFSDDKRLSIGFNGETTVRNSMAIQNIVSTSFPFGVVLDSTGSFKSTSLFWDGRQDDVASMVLEPIQNHIEMGISDMDELMVKVQSIPDYAPLFQSAFGHPEINKAKIATALGSFVVSIRSTQSRFDQSLQNNLFLTPEEQEGANLFFDKYNCNSCHQVQQPFNSYQFAEPPTDPSAQALVGFADIGLDENPTDEGALRTTGSTNDKGKFKIPSLRNIGLTAPYMHDGRFKTLSEVLDHYSNNIMASVNLDEKLRETTGLPKKLGISALEKANIIAFLNSMSDYPMVRDARFSNPFHVR